MNRNMVNLRKGGIMVFIGLIILFVALFAGLFLSGRSNQRKQETYLAEGYSLFSDNNFQDALDSFTQAKATFTTTLSVYRTLASAENHVTQNELAELMVSVCLTAAHENFFKLETADKWVDRAESELKNVKSVNSKDELQALVKTAKEISGLCKDFSEGKVLKALKELKGVEDRALASDQDFFIFEIRFLIACGKALNEQAILAQARELLFFATTDAGIENDKTRRLWGILTN
jgi:hypothetical protein